MIQAGEKYEMKIQNSECTNENTPKQCLQTIDSVSQSSCEYFGKIYLLPADKSFSHAGWIGYTSRYHLRVSQSTCFLIVSTTCCQLLFTDCF